MGVGRGVCRRDEVGEEWREKGTGEEETANMQAKKAGKDLQGCCPPPKPEETGPEWPRAFLIGVGVGS